MPAKPVEPNRLIIARRMIEAAANAGAPCPTNNEICARIGASSPATGARIVSALETMGLIKVHRFHQSRVAVVLQTGKHTAGNLNDPYKRSRRLKGKAGGGRIVTPAPPTEINIVRVNRDPCPRCGVRADKGCGHGNARFVTVMGL